MSAAQEATRSGAEAPKSPQDRESPLLTIMIPVYNGARYLDSLLSILGPYFATSPRWRDRIEIIVFDNLSTDGSARVASRHAKEYEFLHLHAHRQHVPTAEENIFRSFRFCNGTFTWTLGVDDLPNTRVLDAALSVVAEGKYDFYIFNFPTLSVNMTSGRVCNFYTDQYVAEYNLVTLVERFGLWHLIAGISGQIVRTSRVSNYDLTTLIAKTSKIYSHVIAYLECLAGSSCAVVNDSLVFYKIDYKPFDHWRNAATKMEVSDQFFWTTGYVRQVRYLVEKGIVHPDYASRAMDTNDLFFFRPIRTVADKLVVQLKEMGTEDRGSRNWMSPAEFEEVVEFLEETEPFLREILWLCRDIYARLQVEAAVSMKMWARLDEMLSAFVSDFVFTPWLRTTHGDFEIYEVQGRYRAVYRKARALVMDHLRYIEDPDEPPFLFVDDDLERLKERVAEYGVAARLAWEPRELANAITTAMGARGGADAATQAALAEARAARELAEGVVAENARVNGELASLRQEHQAVVSSRSWRMTGPWRRMVGALRA